MHESKKKIGVGVWKRYEIHSVDMVVETNLSRMIKEKSLERVNTSLFSKKERESLDIITKKYTNIADSAFEHWINILRWKSGIYDLCQTKQNRQKSRWELIFLI